MAFKVGLALGGGAGRGLAHIGVIKALREEGIPIHVITGASIGAAIGALYAFDPHIENLRKKVKNFITSEEFEKTRMGYLQKSYEKKERRLVSIANIVRRGVFYGFSAMTKGFISEEEFTTVFDSIMEDTLIEKAEIPFACVATDLNRGEEVILKEGPLRASVCASTAIPGVYPPVSLNGKYLVDGGWLNRVPVNAAYLLGADMVIAVDVSRETEGDDFDYKTGLDVVIRANEITRDHLNDILIQEAGFVLRPRVSDVHWADFTQFDLCVEEGEKEVHRQRKALRSTIQWARLKAFLGIKKSPRFK